MILHCFGRSQREDWTSTELKIFQFFEIIVHAFLYFGRINEISCWRAMHIAKHLHR